MIWCRIAVQHNVCERYGAVMQYSILFVNDMGQYFSAEYCLSMVGAVMEYGILFVNGMGQ
jgi:hypothetical protein